MIIKLLSQTGEQYAEFKDDNIGYSNIIEWNKLYFGYHDSDGETWMAFVEETLIHIGRSI